MTERNKLITYMKRKAAVIHKYGEIDQSSRTFYNLEDYDEIRKLPLKMIKHIWSRISEKGLTPAKLCPQCIMRIQKEE